jgi:hypothetical protein
MAVQHARSSLVLFGLLAGTLIAVTVAASAGAVIVLSDRLPAPPSPSASPLSSVTSRAISPSRALASLAGANDLDVIDRALAANDSDTAFATLLYSAEINDQVRAGSLLSLARLLAQSKKSAQALSAVRSAVDIALLSPSMSDYSRSVALDQAGQILVSLSKKDEAIHAYTAAATIATQSGRIDPGYRQMLLEGLATDLTHMGSSQQARSLRAAVSNPPSPDTTSAVLPGLLVPLTNGTGAAWSDLETTMAKRIDLAAGLISSLNGQSPVLTETVRQQLAATLVSEDRLRLQIDTAGISQSSNLLQRIAFARERTQWLTQKWRITRQGFGMTLVPAWEEQRSDIEASLDKAYSDYYVILRDAAISLPGYHESAQALVEIVQLQIEIGRLGVPMGFQEADLLRDLDNAQRDLSNRGGANLYVKVVIDKGNSYFTVAGNQ